MFLEVECQDQGHQIQAQTLSMEVCQQQLQVVHHCLLQMLPVLTSPHLLLEAMFQDQGNQIQASNLPVELHQQL